MNEMIDSLTIRPIPNTIREEVQRYIGYESLPLRYTSLPIDTTLNSNLNIQAIDIGFLFLMFFPIFYGLSNIKRIKWLFPLLIFYLSVTLPSSFASFMGVNLRELEFWLLNNSKDLNIFYAFCIPLIKLFLPINSWLDHFFEFHSDVVKDYTYLVLIILMTLFLLLINYYKKNFDLKDYLLVIFIVSIFFWIILSGGIPWYIIFIIPIGILMLLIGFEKFNTFYPFVGLTLMLWLFFRLNGFYSKQDVQSYMVEAASIQYQAGILDEIKYQEILTKTPAKLLDFLNKNPSDKIYRNGTNLQFFIKDNKNRVIEDNQLGNFELLYHYFPNKEDLIRALELSGVKFMIIDLNMANIDKTPEKSLFNKFQNLIKVLYENPKLQLIYTDRIVRSSETGELLQMMFDKGQEIVNPGSMAVFMII
jgi:hypothetical protein